MPNPLIGRQREHPQCQAAVDAVRAEKEAEIERLKVEVDRLRYEYRLSEEQYQAETRHSIRLETALKEIIEITDVVEIEEAVYQVNRAHRAARDALRGKPATSERRK